MNNNRVPGSLAKKNSCSLSSPPLPPGTRILQKNSHSLALILISLPDHRSKMLSSRPPVSSVFPLAPAGSLSSILAVMQYLIPRITLPCNPLPTWLPERQLSLPLPVCIAQLLGPHVFLPGFGLLRRQDESACTGSRGLRGNIVTSVRSRVPADALRSNGGMK